MENFLIGIGGGSGSGKTTFAQQIIDSLDSKEVALIHQDAYYKNLSSFSEEERARINYDHPLSFETELLISHLEQLKANLPIDMPIYDYAHHRRKEEAIAIQPVGVIVLEGLLVLEDERLRDLMDIKIFVDTDSDIRFIRRLKRDTKERGRSMESIIDQYLKTVRPMHLEFVEKSKRYADLIVPEGSNAQVLEMVVARIKAFINKNNNLLDK